MSLSSEVLADSPLAYIKLQETSGTSAADASGNAHTGTYEGSPTLGSTGIPEGGTSVLFASASSQDCKLDTLGTLGANLSTLTIEFWIKTTSSGGPQAVLGEVNTGSSDIVAVYLNSDNNETLSAGKTCFHLRGGSASTQRAHITTNIYDGNWHHVVWVVNGTSNAFIVYVDGVSQTVTYNGANATLATGVNLGFPMTIGARNVRATLDRFCDARIAHVAFYTSRLSSTRVSAHYSAGSTVPTIFTDSGSGGFTLAGSKSELKVGADSGSGALTLSGTASELRVYPDARSGGFTLTGSADELYGQGDVVSGGFTLSGTANELVVYVDPATGAFTLSGAFSEARVYPDSGSGGFTLTGSGVDDWAIVAAAPTPTPLQGLDWHVTGLWYPDATTVDYYGRIADPQDGQVRIPLNDSRTAQVTVSVFDPIVAHLNGHTYARLLKVYYNGTLVFWGPCKLNEIDMVAGTATISAVDPSLRLIRHFVRRGDIGGLLGADTRDHANVTVDHVGLRLLRDAGKNTTEQTTRGVPDLGIANGTNDFPAASALDLMDVARGDQVWESMLQLSASLGPDFELEPVEDTAGTYCNLNTYASQGTDLSADVVFHFGTGKDNLENLAFTEGSKYTTHVQVLDRDSTYRVTPANLATSADTGPYVDWDVTEYDVHGMSQAAAENVLEHYGNDVLAAYSSPLIVCTATLPVERASDFRYLTDFGVGDLIGLAGKAGYVTLPTSDYRITAVTIKQEGAENATRTELEVVAPQNPTINTEE